MRLLSNRCPKSMHTRTAQLLDVLLGAGEVGGRDGDDITMAMASGGCGGEQSGVRGGKRGRTRVRTGLREAL